MFCLALEAREINWKCQGLVITRGFKMRDGLSLNNVHIVQCGLVWWLLLLLDSTDPLQSAFLYFLLAPIHHHAKSSPMLDRLATRTCSSLCFQHSTL